MPTHTPTAAATAADQPALATLQHLIERHEAITRPRLRMLWSYYRNPMTIAHAGGDHARRTRLAQERGLPSRLIGACGRAAASTLALDDRAHSAREIVIENDIAWRIQTMVDFMFGRPVTIVSTAQDPRLRRTIERILDAVWERSGGIALLSDIGLLGHIYGHVDLIVRVPPTCCSEQVGASDASSSDAALLALAHNIRIEPIEPTRGVPVPDPDDYRRLSAYIIRATVPPTCCSEQVGADNPPRSRLTRWLTRAMTPAAPEPTPILTEVITAESRTLYLQDDADSPPRRIDSAPALIAARADSGGDRPALPIVHIQNISQPFHYEGLSEVEPLIPLQDELNTRLSDRASRVTMQSFKMYLAKGLEGMDRIPVGPGQVWATDNPDASVEAFGGDGASPSEDAHIEQVREALDKASGVPPLASGVVRAKIGNLTSENALRITLMGLLSKTARKRVTYGRGMAQACELILLALDRAGALITDPADRAVRIEWPDPLPRDERELLEAARAKVELGIPRERVLSELGYAPTDPGIV